MSSEIFAGASEATRRRRTDAVANHVRILEAARAVLVERGLDLEVGEVADRAGVGVGTLYRHFASRDDLVRAVVNQTFEEVLSRLRTAANIADPGAALREIPLTLTIEQSVFAVMRDPRAAKLMQDIKQQKSQPLASEIIDLVAGIVERGMRQETFRSDLDPRTTAVAILGSMAAVFENFGGEQPLAELAAELADLYAHMVTARRPELGDA